MSSLSGLSIGRVIDAFPAFAARRSVWLIAAFSAAYFVLTGARASLTELEVDELYTVWVSRAPTLERLWAALAAGADGNPPLYHFAVRACEALLPAGSLPARLPAMIGLWTMGICVYGFAVRRCAAVYALLAMLFPFLTAAYEFGYYARPYGLLLGFGALALLCWQAACENRARMWALAGLTLSLAAAFCSHFYAVALIVPIGAGEAVRAYGRRRLDVPVGLALVASLLPLAALTPLIEAGRRYSVHFWSKPRITLVPAAYERLLASTWFPLALGMAMAAVLCRWAWRGETREAPVKAPAPEIAALAALAMLPVVVFGMAMFTRAFVVSYPVAMVFGIAVGFALFVASHRHGPVVATSLVLTFGLWFMVKGAYFTMRLQNPGAVDAGAYIGDRFALGRFADFPEILPGEMRTLPVVVADSHLFAEAVHYAAPDVQSKLVYLTDREAALRYAGYDTDELLMPAVTELAGWKLEAYREFVRKQRRFLVIGSGWLIPQLLADGARLALVRQWNGHVLYEVSLGGGA